MMMIDVDGRRRKGRPKRRWMDSVKVDLREKGLSGKETQYRAVRRQLVRYFNPHIQVGNDAIEAGEEDCIIHQPYMIARTLQVIYCNKNNE